MPNTRTMTSEEVTSFIKNQQSWTWEEKQGVWELYTCYVDTACFQEGTEGWELRQKWKKRLNELGINP